MKTYGFKGLLQNDGWLLDAVVTVDDGGIVQSIERSNQADEPLNGFAIPGFQNAHSHAFQYAMAGLAEIHSNNSAADDFWSWREAMYQLALGVSPDQMEAIAAMLYAEMVSHGYTNVAEFHYVHHDKNGKPYSNLGEMGGRLVSAAKTAGIGITLVPIFYQKGGFGQDPNDRQRRFISPTLEEYLRLWEASEKLCADYDHANCGVGIHSMRAVEPESIQEIASSGPKGVPFHIHVSEQLQEIDDSLKYLGQRPVEWLVENLDLTSRFHLVHATHLTQSETSSLAKTGSHVVLCPTTEGNLGDGLFPLRDFQKAGGRWSIGTDSHVSINPLEELRLLDYGQRLISHQRNTFQSADQGNSGHFALEMSIKSGRKAMGNPEEDFFKVGEPFNAMVVDASAPLLQTCSEEALASTIVYSSDSRMQLATISHGRILSRQGVHVEEEHIRQSFASALNELKNR